jgi:MFS family permease
MAENFHDEKLDSVRIKITSFISFLMGFAQAAMVYVLSSYFKLASGTENVGIFYAVVYVIVLLILLNFHKVVRKLGKATVYYLAVLIKIIVLVFLVMLAPSKLGMIFLMVYIIAGALEWTSLDVILESFSKDTMSGRIRGFHLTVLNAGFVFGPFVSTYILDKIGFQSVFIFSLIFNSLVFTLSLMSFNKINHKFEQKLKTSELLKKVIARKNVMRIYYISIVLEFFYSVMVIYTPIYLRDLGFSWGNIGLIFTVMLIPFVLFSYPIGYLADKKTGEKELLIFSLFVMGISTATLYFVGSADILIWSIVLFATRIGASFIGVLQDSYFYKRIDGCDVDIIDFFRTSIPVGYITGAIFSSFIIFFLPIKAVFILAGLVILSALYPAFKLKDNQCELKMPAKCQ